MAKHLSNDLNGQAFEVSSEGGSAKEYFTGKIIVHLGSDG